MDNNERDYCQYVAQTYSKRRIELAIKRLNRAMTDSNNKHLKDNYKRCTQYLKGALEIVK